MSYKNIYYDSNKIHHTKKGFRNSELFNISQKDIKKWKAERKVLPPDEGYENFESFWVTQADFSIDHDAIWWLGHATALIRIQDKTILTDPVFSDRGSRLVFVGPERRTSCASSIELLPKIDIVIISHNHYDHLDYSSVRRIIKRFPLVTIVVPLGLKKQLQSWGAAQVLELDWWENANIDGVILSSVPAKHWSRRGVFDINKTLWCGWMIEYCQRSIYFVGDTGYSSEFTKIKNRFINIDVALIPIGSYQPRWFMQGQHIDPKQALQLFNDIGCKRAIAIHWGAFELADEPLSEPPKLLNSLLDKYNVTDKQFLVMKMGEYLLIT